MSTERKQNEPAATEFPYAGFKLQLLQTFYLHGEAVPKET